MRVIVTRPGEDAQALRLKLESLGHEVILSPLLEIAPIADAVIPADRYQAVAFTSANGARALSAHAALPMLIAHPALTVGPQSGEAARLAGFAEVETAGGDAEGLADHIAATRDPLSGPILYVSGRDSAGDFRGRLERAGFAVGRVIAYEAVPARRLSSEVHSGADAVLLYSPRTARIWMDLIAREGLEDVAMRMKHVCISLNAAAVIADIYPRRVAAEPTDAAMLAVLASLHPMAAR